jgi:hypothetical protein
MKQHDSERFLQLRHLSANGGLLNAIRNAPDRLRDSAMPRDVIKKFEMMNVHAAGQSS